MLGCCRDAPSHSGTSSPGCFWGTAISRSGLNSPYPTGVLACQTQFGLPPVPEGFPLLTSPPGPARPSNPLPRRVAISIFRTFFVFFGASKNDEKTDGQKIDFFRQFWRFWGLQRRFSAIFGLKTDSRRILFRCFLENGDFVKIVLPL